MEIENHSQIHISCSTRLKHRLAIIIPAYKITFIERTIASIANQTCRDFTLYIGNDCSNIEIGNIARKYASQIDIVYQRFDTNLGGKDLVAQWRRCIDLSQGEEWIWLFSDDDIMGERCVELFFQMLKDSYFDIYHFDVKEIDEYGELTGLKSQYPDIVTSYYLYKRKMIGGLLSLVVENIFSRKVYENCNGFQSFDLAWGSDTATWVKFSKVTGMCTISGDFIYWRVSSENITPTTNPEFVVRKERALLSFFQWSLFFFSNDIRWKIIAINILAYIRRMKNLSCYLEEGIIDSSVNQFAKMHGVKHLANLLRFTIKLLSKK